MFFLIREMLVPIFIEIEQSLNFDIKNKPKQQKFQLCTISIKIGRKVPLIEVNHPVRFYEIESITTAVILQKVIRS